MKKLIIILLLFPLFIHAQEKGRAISLPVLVTTHGVSILTNDTLRKSIADTINLVAGDNMSIDYTENGVITFSSSSGGTLPTCSEGEFLAYIGGQWTCVNVCDYICSDTIIDIITNYYDTANVIYPSGEVTINISRADCLDSTQIFASTLAKETLNLTSIKIVSIPANGSLIYGTSTVTAGQELGVTLQSLDSTLYYVSDDGIGSAYSDLFTFQLLYSSNSSYLSTANVNVSVDACVEDQICFGYLYNWYAVDDTREITSSADWTVPTFTQVNDLRNYVTFSTGGDVMKSTSSAFWDDVTNNTNSTGFTAIGSGIRTSTGSFTGLLSAWNAWADDPSRYFYSFSSGSSSFGISSLANRKNGYSIRLVKDATGLADGLTTTYTGNDGKTYNAVVINELYWTTENLEETLYRNLDTISNVTDNTTWSGLTTGAWCLYSNDLNNSCK